MYGPGPELARLSKKILEVRIGPPLKGFCVFVFFRVDLVIPALH